MRGCYAGVAGLLAVLCGHGMGQTTVTLPGQLSGLTTTHDYVSARSASDVRGNNDDFRHIAAGETITLADLTGPGEITHIWTTIASPDVNHLRNLVVRIYWDGRDYPSVESPIGDFFGLGHAKYYYFSNPAQAIGTNNGLNCFWPMPFREHARITVTNQGDVPVDRYYWYVDWRKRDSLPENSTYFHAQYRQAMPNVDGENYVFMQTSGGAGHYAGVNLSIHTQTAGWWGEGDDIITVDGETKPSLWGTGSEDYFSGAWGFGEEFYTDYFGMPLRTRVDQSADNYWNVYRLHLESPITFTESIKVEMEHGLDGVSNERPGSNNDYSSCAYWYVDNPRPLVGDLPPADERLPEYRLPEAPEGVYEAQYMDMEGPTEKVEAQPMSRGPGWPADWLNDDQLWGPRIETGDVVKLTFELEEAVSGDEELVITRAKDYGRFTLSLDERVFGVVDGYDDQVTRARVPLEGLGLAAGTHTLTIKMEGKAPESEGTMWGVDYLRVGGAPVPDDVDLPVVEPEGSAGITNWQRQTRGNGGAWQYGPAPAVRGDIGRACA